MFSKGIYRHSKCLDVDLRVYDCYPTLCGWTVRGALFNRYNGIFYELGDFNVSFKERPFWENISEVAIGEVENERQVA